MAHPITPKPGAVIIGGHFLSLGAARNLAKRGVPVFLVDDEICVAQFSRCVTRSFRCPSYKDETEFVDYLQRLAGKEGLEGSVLFPSTDESVRILSKHRDTLSEHYRVTTPEWDIIKHLYDKRLTHVLALKQGVPVPWTCNPRSVGELAASGIEYPVVLKSAISTHLSAVTKKKAYRADNVKELLTTYERMAAIIDPAEILVQELIPGRAENLYSYFGFFKEGKPSAGYSAKRSRQHPMEFGRASTFAVTVNLPELEQWSTTLLSGIGYTGLAEVEFMYDTKHARFEFLEVNARIWGWITLADHAGVDLPYIAYAEMVGEEVSGQAFREGAKWMRLTTDIPTVASEMRHGRLTPGDYLRSVWGSQDAVFSFSDPLPFLAELMLIPYYAKHRGF
jgi:D-aspartate ligase